MLEGGCSGPINLLHAASFVYSEWAKQHKHQMKRVLSADASSACHALCRGAKVRHPCSVNFSPGYVPPSHPVLS